MFSRTAQQDLSAGSEIKEKNKDQKDQKDHVVIDKDNQALVNLFDFITTEKVFDKIDKKIDPNKKIEKVIHFLHFFVLSYIETIRIIENNKKQVEGQPENNDKLDAAFQNLVKIKTADFLDDLQVVLYQGNNTAEEVIIKRGIHEIIKNALEGIVSAAKTSPNTFDKQTSGYFTGLVGGVLSYLQIKQNVDKKTEPLFGKIYGLFNAIKLANLAEQYQALLDHIYIKDAYKIFELDPHSVFSQVYHEYGFAALLHIAKPKHLLCATVTAPVIDQIIKWYQYVNNDKFFKDDEVKATHRAFLFLYFISLLELGGALNDTPSHERLSVRRIKEKIVKNVATFKSSKLGQSLDELFYQAMLQLPETIIKNNKPYQRKLDQANEYKDVALQSQKEGEKSRDFLDLLYVFLSKDVTEFLKRTNTKFGIHHDNSVLIDDLCNAVAKYRSAVVVYESENNDLQDQDFFIVNSQGLTSWYTAIKNFTAQGTNWPCPSFGKLYAGIELPSQGGEKSDTGFSFLQLCGASHTNLFSPRSVEAEAKDEESLVADLPPRPSHHLGALLDLGSNSLLSPPPALVATDSPVPSSPGAFNQFVQNNISPRPFTLTLPSRPPIAEDAKEVKKINRVEAKHDNQIDPLGIQQPKITALERENLQLKEQVKMLQKENEDLKHKLQQRSRSNSPDAHPLDALNRFGVLGSMAVPPISDNAFPADSSAVASATVSASPSPTL